MRRPSWLSSTLAAAVTGLKDTRRKLHTDAERLDRSFQAALIFTSRTANFVRSDTAQRTVPLWVAGFQSGRLGESQLHGEVQQRRDALLSWVVSKASQILGVLETAPANVPVRFVDFSKTVWAYQSLFEGPDVADALQALVRAQELLLLKKDALIQAVCRFVAEHPTWEGTATELLRGLQDCGSNLPDMRGKAVAYWLRRSGSILRMLGIDVGARDSGNATIFTLTA